MKTTKTSLRLKYCAVGAALLAAFLASQPATAATITWNNNGTDWGTAANWTGGVPINNSVITFSSASYTAQPIIASTTAAKGNTMVASGAGTLTISGIGTNTLAGAGGITLQSGAGSLTISAPLALGVSQTYLNSSVNPLTISAVTLSTFTLSLDGAGAGGITASGIIGGSGGLTLKSTFSSTATLQAANIYSGATTLNGGKLMVTGSLGSSSAVAVNSGATLGGTGTIGGATTVNSGGTLAPGVGGIGTLTFSSSLSLAGTNSMEINRAGNLADKITMTSGTVTLGGVLSVVNVGSALQGGETFALISGTIAGGYASITPATPGSGLQWDMSHLTAGGDGTLRVLAVAPVAGNDSYSLPANSIFITNAPGVLLNDSEPGFTLIATNSTSTTNGTLAINADGSFTYTPNPGFSGTDSFTYQAFDGTNFSLAATVTLTISPASNVAPVAANDSYSLTRNGSFTNNAPGVLANDTDANSDPLTATNFTSPAHGTLTYGTDGSFTYTPTGHYAGTDTFTYEAYDGQTTSQVATVTMTVVDRPPVAINDGFPLTSNSVLNVAAPGVLSNDTDADGDVLTAAVVANPAHGSVTLNTDGSFTYTPNGSYFGADSFTYQASDGLSNSVTATVILTNAPGGIYTWNGGTSGSWNTAANWSANDVPITKSVRYDNTSTGNLEQTLDRNWSIAGITVADLSSPVTIDNGGILTNTGGIDMSGAGADLTILADYVSGGTASIAANRTLTLSNVLGGSLNGASGPGTLRLVGKAAPGQMVDSTGSLTFVVDGGYISSNPPVRLGAEAGGTVRLVVTNNGTIQILGNGVKLHVGFNTNSGTAGTNILDVESGSIVVAPSGTTGPSGIYVPNGSNSSGIFNLNGGLVVLTNKYSNNTGLAGESTLQIPFSGGGMGVVNLNGGTLVVPTITAATLTTGSGTLNFNGTVVTANRPHTNWIANIQNAYVQAGGAIFDTGTNAVTIPENLQAGSPSGGLIKQGAGGILTLKGTNTYTGATTINNGTLALAANGSIATSPAIALGLGATFDVSALTTTFTLGAGQTLSGNGTNVGAMVNDGTVAPGSGGIGTLTFGTAPTLDGGTLQMKVSGPGSADQIVLTSGALAYSGTLTIVNAGGALSGGEVFTLFTPAGSGSFTATNLPALGAGLNWWLGNLTNNGSLVVNREPTGVAAHTYTRASGTGLKIAKADLLAGVSDPDSGDSVLVGGLVSMTSGQGATVTQDADFFHYTPSNDNNDTLQFIVVDTRGAAVTNNIVINVTPSIGVVQGITPPAGGSASLSFAGIAGYSYGIQRSTNLTAWVTLTTTNAPTGGLFQWVDDFSDLGSVPPQAFYRLQTPVAP